ncbi:uncharacterized protein LOC106169966 [Lingula anatina]|uniref:Uncharacterized protein LOC106169966 n=1 Tax=Lingula anatina TaxID=7574 RepID=A0A1S3J5J6_LINAN|nr:uncharacterized protein LOC106169966 [Lingula anatina]|eukprot:XP_013405104.1 uncharacterized protein LOC106169966 [Lingula anatina]
MAESDVSELTWSKVYYSTEEVVEKFSLPFIVKVAEGFYGERDYESFSSDDILKIYAKKSLQKVEARVPGSSENVSIPLAYTGAVKILPLMGEHHIYSTIGEAIDEEMPSFLKIGKPISPPQRLGHNVRTGTILQIDKIEKRMTPKGIQEFVLCHGDGRDLCLPRDFEGDFTVVPDTQHYRLSDVINQKPLPCRIKIVGGRERLALSKDVQEGISNLEDFSGEFTLIKLFMQEVLVASTQIHEEGCPKQSLISKKNITLIPLSPVSLNVSFFVAEESPDYHRIIVKSFGTEIDVSQVDDDEAYIEYVTKPRSRVYSDSALNPPTVPPRSHTGDGYMPIIAESQGDEMDSDSGDGYEEIDDDDLEELKASRARREARQVLFEGEEDQHGYLIPKVDDQNESNDSEDGQGNPTKKKQKAPNLKKALGTVRGFGKSVIATLHQHYAVFGGHQHHSGSGALKTIPAEPPQRPPKPARLRERVPNAVPCLPYPEGNGLSGEHLDDETPPPIIPRTPKTPTAASPKTHQFSPTSKEFWFPSGRQNQEQNLHQNSKTKGDADGLDYELLDENVMTELRAKSKANVMTESKPVVFSAPPSRSKSEKPRPALKPKPKPKPNRQLSDNSLLGDKREDISTTTSRESKVVPTATISPSQHIARAEAMTTTASVKPTVLAAILQTRYQNEEHENTPSQMAEHIQQHRQQEHHQSLVHELSQTLVSSVKLKQELDSQVQLRQREEPHQSQSPSFDELRKSLPYPNKVTSDDSAPSIKEYGDVPSDLSMLTVDGLEAVLQVYGLHNAAKICKVNEVDGALFMLLTDNILKEDPFNLKPFDILKIQNIKRGWKPKQSAPSAKSFRS